MNPVIIIFLLLWLIYAIRSALFHVALWQQKEYRWDRMREHLSLASTKKQVLHPINVAKIFLLVTILAGFTNNVLLVYLLFVVYILQDSEVLLKIRKHSLPRPVITGKAIGLVATNGIIFILLPFLITLFFPVLRAGSFIVADLLFFLIAAITVAFIHPFSMFFKGRIIAQAKKLRDENSGVKVVGITGSYGKSSTKNILAQLLAEEGGLGVTPGNTNTEIGVAQIFIKKLKKDVKYFLVEMGAYRKGEISKLTAIARPEIGILTAVSNQHLGLFGSLDNIREAKYELILALPSTGTAIFNADDAIAAKLAKRTKHCRVVTYGINNQADLKGRLISADETGIKAVISGLVPETEIFFPLLGEHQLENVLASICAALALNISMDTIVERLKSVTALKNTMETIDHPSGAKIIDDSYNANTVGVLSAIKTLSLVTRKNKVIVLAPLMELGAEAPSEHRRIGEALRGKITKVFYVGEDFSEEIKAGLGDESSKLVNGSPEKLNEEIKKYLNSESAVLVEGRVARFIRENLLIK